MNIELFRTRLDACLDALRTIPVDALLAVSTIAVVLFVLSIVARISGVIVRRKVERRYRALEAENERLAAEVATSRKALDTERQWRMAAERTVAQTASKPSPNISPLPARELQGLLESEYPGSPQPMPATSGDGKDAEASAERSTAGTRFEAI
jgi:hypothetical protein